MTLDPAIEDALRARYRTFFSDTDPNTIGHDALMPFSLYAMSTALPDTLRVRERPDFSDASPCRW